MATTLPTRGPTLEPALTRSLLAWGAVVGPIYLGVGLAQALARDGFDLAQHALSLLMLGEHGWIQRANLAAAGMMVLAAAIGFGRASGRPGPTVALGMFSVSLMASAAFVPDPMLGFPPGSTSTPVPSTSGMMHLAAGAVGFIALALAALGSASWFAHVGVGRVARLSRAAAGVIGAAFLAGAALATRPVGVALIWVAVLVGFGWLALASLSARRLARDA